MPQSLTIPRGSDKLALLQDARKALAQAKTLDEAKGIRDQAETIRAHMAIRGESLESINLAAEIKLRAERRLGEMLADTPMRDGGQAMKARSHAVTELPSTLAEMGIGKMDSSRWQTVAAVPEEAFERHVETEKAAHRELTTAGVLELARDARNETKRAELIDRARAIPEDDRARLVVSRMEDFLPTLHDLDAIITDPPYPEKFLPLYGELARLAKSALKPDGVLAVMCGQSYLPRILADMCAHMPYRWTMAYLTPGGQSVQLWKAKVNTFWKPILVFGNVPAKWSGDVVKSDVNDNDKRFHGWGQSESGMARIVEALTEPGQTVCDPFMGAGTTGVACVALGRKFVGCDVNAEAVEITKGRIAEVQARLA